MCFSGKITAKSADFYASFLTIDTWLFDLPLLSLFSRFFSLAQAEKS
jgi:hypothetical protein